MEIKHYPASVCEACHRTGGGPAARSLLREDVSVQDVELVHKLIKLLHKFEDDVKEIVKGVESAERRRSRECKANGESSSDNSPPVS
jgi:hypothetical protein